MVTMRSSAPTAKASALSVVVLPLDVPPETRLERRGDDPLRGERVSERGLEHLTARPSIRSLSQTRDDAALDAPFRRLGAHDASMSRSCAMSSYARPSAP